MNQQTEVIEPGVLAVLSRSEIDAQVASSVHRPRSLDRFRDTARAIATINEEAAAECLYTLPARSGGKGEPIEGPSVRFAEILVSAFGNCRVGARVIEEAPSHVTAQGIFHDLESNAVTTFEVRRRIVDKTGRRYSADMVNVTCNAACSIARRNAILQAIPKPLWFDLYKQARAKAAGDAKDLPERIDQAIAAFERIGINSKRLFASVGVKDRKEIGADELTRMRGTYQAIKDGELSIEEAFPIEKKKAYTAEDLRKMQPSSTSPAPPDIESAADAYALGQKAFRAHAGRTQWPGGWRDQMNIDSWLTGWDDEKIAAEIKDEEERPA